MSNGGGGVFPMIMNGLKILGGGASEVFAPGNPIGIAAMGSGIGGFAGQGAGGNQGGAMGSSIGGLLGGLGGGAMGGGGMDPMSMMGGGSGGGMSAADAAMAMSDPSFLAAQQGVSNPMDPNNMGINSMNAAQGMMGGNPMSANAGPAMPGMGGSGGGAGGSPGIMNALFSSGSSGAPSAQTLIAQGMDPYQAYQLQALNQQQNPSLFNQSMGAMGPVGQQLLQYRQAQQLAAMSHQAPTANLQGGANPVPGSFGTAGPSTNPSTMSMPQQYVQMLAMLGR